MEDGLSKTLKASRSMQNAACRMRNAASRMPNEERPAASGAGAQRETAEGKPTQLRVRMRVRRKAVWGLATAGAIALVAACGGGTMSPSGGGGTPPPNTTITITSSGVSPKNL